jgi:hypothetical protein
MQAILFIDTTLKLKALTVNYFYAALQDVTVITTASLPQAQKDGDLFMLFHRGIKEIYCLG